MGLALHSTESEYGVFPVHPITKVTIYLSVNDRLPTTMYGIVKYVVTGFYYFSVLCFTTECPGNTAEDRPGDNSRDDTYYLGRQWDRWKDQIN